MNQLNYFEGILPKSPEYPKDKEIEIDGVKKLSPEDKKEWEKDVESFDWEENRKQVKKRYSEIRKEFKKQKVVYVITLVIFVKYLK